MSAGGRCRCGRQDEGPTVALRADRLALPARLVWSKEGGSFHHGGYWVVVDSPSNSGDSANAWCDAEDLPADGCYAKRPTTSGGFAGNTIPRG